MRRANWIGLVASVGILVTRSAWTQEPPPPPTFGYYSLPIGMRPVLAVTGLRLDSSIGLSHDRMNNPVSTEVSILSARYRISDGLTVGAAAAFIYDHPEAPQLQTAAWSNVQLGAAYAHRVGEHWILSPALALGLPVGAGGGNMPDRGAVLAQFEALLTRAAYNVGFFSPNDLILSGVFDVAWLWNRVTLQGEVTLAQLIRVKGEIAEPDEFITLATGGVHLGYFALPMLSGGVELRYVGLLTTPELVKKDPSTREQFSVGVGVRTHLQAGRLSLHPGIYYVRGLDDPMARAGFNIIGLDLPVVFGSAGRASTQSAPPGQ